jgi:very-short-patch-repair endonuclease
MIATSSPLFVHIAHDTPQARALWSLLRTRPGGHRFRRNQPVCGTLVSFYASSLRLGIELGPEPRHPERQAGARERAQRLERAGIAVVRLADEQIARDAVDALIAARARQIGAPVASAARA